MRVLLILLVSVSALAQELKCVNGRAELQQVVALDSLGAKEVYKLAHRWIAKSFHNTGRVIESEIENEMISGRAYERPFVKIAFGVYGDLSYSFTMDVKDGKIRLTLSNMVTSTTRTASYKVETYCCKGDGSIRSNSQSQNIKESVELYMKSLVLSLRQLQEKRDEW